MEISRYPNKLKMHRRVQGYSQKKVTRLLSLKDTGTISRWERGISMPSLRNVLRLANIYIARPEELYPSLFEEVAATVDLYSSDEKKPFPDQEPTIMI